MKSSTLARIASRSRVIHSTPVRLKAAFSISNAVKPGVRSIEEETTLETFQGKRQKPFPRYLLLRRNVKRADKA